jgi:hypothetical protein
MTSDDYKRLAELADDLDQIETDAGGKCNWADVASVGSALHRFAALRAASVKAGEVVAWQWRGRMHGEPWTCWVNGRTPNPIFEETETRPLYTAPTASLGAMREALSGLIEAVRRDADDGGKGISGYTSARLSDARSALAAANQSDGGDLDARFKRLGAEASDLGYVLTPEPEHPDSPHDTPPAPQAVEAVSVEEVAWRQLDSAPRDGTPINVRAVSTYRYQPYKPNSPQRKKGIRGRWQVVGEYGGWSNCAEPCGEWSSLLSDSKVVR